MAQYPKLEIKQDLYPTELKKGQAIIYERPNKSLGLILCCPKCGYASTGTHKYNIETKTLKPSIKCGKKGCGYHGYLKNGIFTDA